MRKRLIQLGNGRLIYTREPVEEEAMDAREPVNEDGDEWEEGGKGGGVSGGGAGMKEKEVDEVTHGCEGNGDVEMEGACSDDEEREESDSDDSFIDDSLDGEEPLVSENDNDSQADVPPLTDAEVEELVSELLEIESKAAEAQETLELESLKQVENEVRAELAQNLQGDELEKAVTTEMKTFTEQWEMTLDELETESSLLLEQLDGAGVGLPSLYKWVESQVPNGCSTEAWRNRAHWVGSQVTVEVNEAVAAAEKHLQSCRPVRKKHGKLLEEGAGGFLARKLAITENGTLNENPGKDWSSFNEYIKSAKHDDISLSFGSEQWASVYLASTPQQAANMGLAFPGVDEVEEIDEICTDSCDPFYADALSNEKGMDLSEEQKRNFRKVREEDDAIITNKLRNHLKRRRHKSWNCQIHSEDGGLCSNGISAHKVESDAFACSDLNGSSIGNLMNSSCAMTSRDGKHLWHSEDIDTSNRRCPTVIIDSDDEVVQLVDKLDASICSPHESSGQSSIQAKVVDIIDVDSFQATEFMKDFNCTACVKGLQASQVHKHPLLGVIVCEHCKCVMDENMQSKGLDPANCYCRWCGRSTDLMNCNSCNMLFCTMCIKRNLGEDQLLESKASSWQCCCCSPNLLRKLISDYEIASGSVVVCSSKGQSELSDSDCNISTSKKRRKRKIRRILDDAELREETKQKIEIEKARQEHLKSMQFAGHRCKNEALIQNMAEGATVEVLGDATMGYIVNVAREEDEEPVRIPPSISSKLKPHQIVGIRFMWENIIQSVRKVQSGDKGLGCILAHTMGLGKTFQVIAFLYTALRSIDLGLKTALIVTPVNVLHNWRHEFMKWKPVDVKTLRVFMLEDVHRDKRAHLLSKWRAKGGVLLIGYAAFRDLSFGKHVKDRNKAIEICYALQHGADILVCDEAHMIKNTRADITHALKQVKSQRRIALTGSPLQNNLMEYYCMVDFVREGFLGSSHEFKNRFQNPIENGQHTNSTSVDVKIMNQRSHILYEQLKGFVQRMDMNVVKNELPPKTVYVISVKLSPLQKKLYKRFLDVHGYTDKMVSTDKTVRRSCFFAGYQALAQIWNHPGLLQMAKELKGNRIREDIVENFLGDDSSSDDNIGHGDLLDGGNHRSKNDTLHKRSDQIFFPEEVDWWKDLLCDKIYKEVDYSGKMVLLLDILTMSSEVGDKTLVFSQSLATLDLIELFLSKFPRKGREGKYWKLGKDWYRLDGRTKGSERQKIIERFNETSNKRVKCTLISTRAGSLGINLHAANRVIIVDGSWNPTNDLQAIYRVWRYGQMKPVYVYRLMAHKTMEEKIYKRQVTKEGLAARVVDRQQIHRTMSKEEVLHLFDFGEDENIDSVLEQIQDTPLPSNQERKSGLADFLKQKSISASHEVGLSDKFMESLLNRYYPRWIQDFHEHETLLQENEEERLSKEEQDMAWETFLRTIEWEEVQRVPEEPIKFEQKPPKNPAPSTENNYTLQGKGYLQNQPPVSLRKCTNLSHLLTLRSQGTKSGSCTLCKECSQEISWENLSRDGKPR